MAIRSASKWGSKTKRPAEDVLFMLLIIISEALWATAQHDIQAIAFHLIKLVSFMRCNRIHGVLDLVIGRTTFGPKALDKFHVLSSIIFITKVLKLYLPTSPFIIFIFIVFI
jgi:hypothetical protein